MSTVREWTTPPKYVPSGSANATDDVIERAASRPDHEAFRRLVDGRWRSVTSKEFADQVIEVARGLVAADVRPGDRVAIMSGTRYEWTLCDYAIWMAGGVVVPIYETSSVEQVEWILSDSGTVGVFVENAEQAAVVEKAGVPSVRHLWRFDPDGPSGIEPTGLDGLTAAAASVPVEEVEARRRGLAVDTVATIVYTSGTTGRPKGCVLTHGSLLSETENVTLADGMQEKVLTEDASTVLFLPLAHIFARAIQLSAVHNGVLLAHTSDLKALPATLAALRPTLLLSVPRVFEKLYNTARSKATDEGHLRIFEAAEATAAAYSKALESGGPGPLLRIRRAVFDRLVYRKLREAMGGRIAWAISGGAPLNPELGHFLRGAGVAILEGWGLTETTAGATLNLPDAQRIGTVGRPIPGCEVRIAPDGEVLVKGPTVLREYWRNEEATREAFTDGWFRTGDVGELDGDGFLRITGRKKDLIVTAAGKNVAPAILEDRLRSHWLIGECVVVGDQRPFIAALITLDLETLPRWKRTTGKPEAASISELRQDADLITAIQQAIDETNAAVSKAEAIKRFRILSEEFSIGAELTPTQKVRRHHVLAKFAADVEALYRR